MPLLIILYLICRREFLLVNTSTVLWRDDFPTTLHWVVTFSSHRCHRRCHRRHRRHRSQHVPRAMIPPRGQARQTSLGDLARLTSFLLREAIWPSNKILPNKWSKWREDRNSLCQMILRKVAIPVGVDGQSYWEAMILGITNDKFCALRANFKQELFKQFQGKYV